MTSKKKKIPKKTTTTRKKKNPQKQKAKLQPNAAFMKIFRPSKELEKIFEKSTSRTEVMKKVWAYIRKNSLIKETKPKTHPSIKGLKATRKKAKLLEPGIGGGRNEA